MSEHGHGAHSAVPTRSRVSKGSSEVRPRRVGTAERAPCINLNSGAAFAHPTRDFNSKSALGIELAHGSGEAVDLDAIAGCEPLERALEADNARNAELTRHDG
jgi:hypothetical protein